ncbi:ribonuclease H-like domain-containing protein [Tanacetum coccineum]
MTRSSSTMVFTPFTNPERKFRTRRGTTPISIHNIYSFYESESFESKSEEVGEINIATLTLEQYLALDRNDIMRGIKRLEIGKNIEFEIKGQFLRKLCDNTFSGNETEDAIENIGRVLEIASLFNTPGVLGDDTMLWVFPVMLVGTTKRWLGRTLLGTLTTWDELKQVFIRRYCPPSITFKRLGEIHNFRQEEGESLYRAWERYNDLLFKCLFHDLNDYQKVNTFYNGLGFHSRQTLDSRSLIPGLTAAKSLESIQEMADHSHKWHNEEGDRRISNNGSNSLSTITDKLNNLNRDMNDLRENVYKIHPKSNNESCHEEVKSI